MKITKKVREEAALIAAIWASTPGGWDNGRWSEDAEKLYRLAFHAAHVVLHGRPARGMYCVPYDTQAHEAAAGAAQMLREGWSP